MQIDAGIMSRVEISYQLHSPAQAAATDVEQPVVWHESLRHQKVELELANFIPEPADALAMPAGLHLRLQGSLVVVTADHHPLQPLCAGRARTEAGCAGMARQRRHASRMPIIPPLADNVDNRR